MAKLKFIPALMVLSQVATICALHIISISSILNVIEQMKLQNSKLKKLPEARLETQMEGVIKKFFIASMLMWIAPIAILYGFNHNLFPGSTQLSSYSATLLSGFLAVISVNIVIAFYICMAMKEPSDKHEPDPAFLAEAKASVSQSTPGATEDSSQSREKQE